MCRFHVLAVTALSFLARPAPSSDCSKLAAAKLPDTTIATAARVPAGRFNPPYGDPVADLPAFCRVAGVIRPTGDSEIRFEVWLPEKDWNGRYLGVGNGGFAGTIDFKGLGTDLKHGFATAATDTGHQGQGTDATWGFKHPEKVVDFGWRALHLTTVNAKQLLASYYGSNVQHSYFDSCSDGGREALMEAQRFPDDFDGILAGAPANNWTALLSSGADLLRQLRHPDAYISGLKLPAISAAVLDACGAQSGVKEDFVNDPPHCRFNPDVLLCKGDDSLTCLTAPQLAFLKTIYAGVTTAGSQQVIPGHPPGGELGPGGWGSWILGNSPDSSNGSDFVRNNYRYIVFDDPTWTPFQTSFETDLKMADKAEAQALNSTNPDLRAFASHGGKLILYHGWSDPGIQPENTIDYYTNVQNKMGADMAAKFVRLYMVPGMQHCVGGPGPNAFGQLGLPAPAEGALTALEHWVEDGTVPGNLTAAKYSGDDYGGKLQMTRPLCPYPQIAKFKGIGDPKDAASFACISP